MRTNLTLAAGRLGIQKATADMLRWLPWGTHAFKPPPLLFITHAKAGSTWIDGILRTLYGRQVAPRQWPPPERFSFARHRIHSAVFMTRDQFLRHPELRGIHRFVVIRDLRDTLVSDYFSLRDTHVLDEGGIIAQRREELRTRTPEEGLAYLIDHVLEQHAAIQSSWIGGETPVLRYEELLRDDVALFRTLLLEKFGHAIPESQLSAAVESNRFEKVFQRKLGEENPASHGRKGAPGDWRNHFTPALRRHFAERFGDLLIATGYEHDAAWVATTP